MLLSIVTPFSLVQGYKRFGSIFNLHLEDILKKVAVLSPYHPLPVCHSHNVSTAVINQPTTNNHTQPCLKYVTFSITRSCRGKMFHIRSLKATGFDLLYSFCCTSLPFVAILWPIEAVHQYIVSCDWTKTHSLVYNVPRATVTIRHNINICYWKL